jgi:Uma2 family endonuclease
MHGDWATYEALLEARGERSCPRIAYLDGVLQLMSPALEHEMIKSAIGDLVKQYCLETQVAYTGAGSWTLRRQLKQAGLEPDDCLIFGDDPRRKQRPDLAIDVISIAVYVLANDHYVEANRSACLPEIDLALIARLALVEPTSSAVLELREILRQGT